MLAKVLTDFEVVISSGICNLEVIILFYAIWFHCGLHLTRCSHKKVFNYLYVFFDFFLACEIIFTQSELCPIFLVLCFVTSAGCGKGG